MLSPRTKRQSSGDDEFIPEEYHDEPTPAIRRQKDDPHAELHDDEDLWNEMLDQGSDE